MATKVKTTVTFTFSFQSESTDTAIRSLRSWFKEQTDDDIQVVRDSDMEEYTYLNTEPSIGHTFKFKTPAEFIEKYSRDEGCYAPTRAMLDYASHGEVSAKVETIEVKEEE